MNKITGLKEGDVVRGIFTGMRLTNGSPFGEQWSTIETKEGNAVVATWFNWNNPGRPKEGDEIEVVIGAPQTCHCGGGSKMVLEPNTRNWRVVRRKPVEV